MYLTIPYLEELRDGNAINGVRFLTPEHLKQHVFHAGKIVRLNISVRWRKKWIDRWTTRPHSRTGGGNRHFVDTTYHYSTSKLKWSLRSTLKTAPSSLHDLRLSAGLFGLFSHEKASCTSGRALLRQFVRRLVLTTADFLESMYYSPWLVNVLVIRCNLFHYYCKYFLSARL